MRLLPALLIGSMLTLNGCSGTYEHTVGGAAIGAGTGAAVGFLSSPKDLGPGILIGAGVGALLGILYDAL